MPWLLLAAASFACAWGRKSGHFGESKAEAPVEEAGPVPVEGRVVELKEAIVEEPKVETKWEHKGEAKGEPKVEAKR
jgi:hypothetical protein